MTLVLIQSETKGLVLFQSQNECEVLERRTNALILGSLSSRPPPSAKVAPHRPQCGVPPKSVVAPNKTHAWQMPPVKLKTQNEYVPHGQPAPQKKRTTRYHNLGHKNRYITT